MTVSLKDKSLMITGAASGIGAACARLAATVGAKLVLCDRDRAAGEALASALRDSGATCLFQVCDVVDESQVAGAVARCIEAHGGLDGAANCAGIVPPAAALEDTTLEEWQRVIDVNLTAVFLCVKHQLRQMKLQGSGAIVNVSSGAGLDAAPAQVPYTAAKHGVLGLAKNAVRENARSGIRVNSVLPGLTRTPMLEKAFAGSPELENMLVAGLGCGRMAEAEEQARPILWLLSDEASYINGDSLVVDGGLMCR